MSCCCSHVHSLFFYQPKHRLTLTSFKSHSWRTMWSLSKISPLTPTARLFLGRVRSTLSEDVRVSASQPSSKKEEDLAVSWGEAETDQRAKAKWGEQRCTVNNSACSPNRGAGQGGVLQLIDWRFGTCGEMFGLLSCDVLLRPGRCFFFLHSWWLWGVSAQLLGIFWKINTTLVKTACMYMYVYYVHCRKIQ